MISHKGKGSILKTLKDKGWINDLESDLEVASKSVEFFTVQIDLTKEGTSHIDEIVTMFFQYVNMIKKEGAVKRIFDVSKKIF